MKSIIMIISGLLISFMLGFTSMVPKYEKPILISSAGQSADVTLAGTLFKKIKVDVTVLPLAKKSDLNGVKTLVVVPGFSSKGLGAAGISREQEFDRIKELISSAKTKKMKIVMLHLGGVARRGNQSDDFNQMVANASDVMVVVKTGDTDQFFTNIANKRNVNIKIIDKIADAIPVIQELF
jgi:hypothetical protein